MFRLLHSDDLTIDGLAWFRNSTMRRSMCRIVLGIQMPPPILHPCFFFFLFNPVSHCSLKARRLRVGFSVVVFSFDRVFFFCCTVREQSGEKYEV